MDWFRTKDHPAVLQALDELQEQFKLNVDDYTKFKKPPTEIQRFYAGKSIFLTGATGFMGKCFVEKVLRDCSDLKHLYLLVRSDRGVTVQERMKKYFSNIIFDRLRKIDPNFEDKVVIVEGDLGVENLGLLAEDRQMLIDNVNIIVHNGATVKFNETVRVALRINVLATRDILELTVACKHIEAFAYVSTAYSHCYMKHIKEEFYEPAADLKIIHDMIAADQAGVNGLSEESTKMFLGKWPNIYTFTKSVSEDLIRQYGERVDFPCCIFRPSMVMGASKEPLIGWFGNSNGPTTSIIAVGLGLVHVLMPSEVMDIVPVDYSINALIVSIYDHSKQWDLERRPRVYNFASSVANPITMKQIYEIAYEMYPSIPSSKAVWYAFAILTSYNWQFYILHFFLHFIPAIFADFVLLCMRKKPRALSICMAATRNLHWLMYFTNFGWRIQATEMRRAFERIDEQDRKLFNFDIWNLDWVSFSARNMCGGRFFCLKEPSDNVAEAKRRFVILRTIHYIVLTVFYLIVGYYFLRLFL